MTITKYSRTLQCFILLFQSANAKEFKEANGITPLILQLIFLNCVHVIPNFLLLSPVRSAHEKKKRVHRNFDSAATYYDEASVQAALADEGSWGYYYQIQSRHGRRVTYRCNEVKGKKCPASLYLLFVPITTKAWRAAKTLVREQFLQGAKPKAIMRML